MILAKQFAVRDNKLSPKKYHFHQVAEILQDIRHQQLFQGDKLQMSAKNCCEPVVGQTIFFMKNPDNKQGGILFGSVLAKDGSDYTISIANGGKTTEIIFLIYGDQCPQ